MSYHLHYTEPGEPAPDYFVVSDGNGGPERLYVPADLPADVLAQWAIERFLPSRSAQSFSEDFNRMNKQLQRHDLPTVELDPVASYDLSVAKRRAEGAVARLVEIFESRVRK